MPGCARRSARCAGCTRSGTASSSATRPRRARCEPWTSAAAGRSRRRRPPASTCSGRPGVDVVADLRAGLPLADRSVDRIYAVHVLEHVLDLVPLMNELHRVLADDGVLHVLSPHWQAIGAVADPTHVKYLDVQTFKWFCGPHGGSAIWYPLHAGYDGASVFADLRPVRRGEPLAPVERLARYFD